MENNIVTPVNPALAFEPLTGDNHLKMAPNGATAIGLDISLERGIELIKQLDETKELMFGDRPHIRLVQTFQVMSYVAKTSQELIYLVYTTGKVYGKENLNELY